MKHLPLRECGYAIVFIVALLALYAGAYLAMLQRVDLAANPITSPLKHGSAPVAFYRFGGEWSRGLFTPIHEFDRHVRPELWKGEVVTTIFDHAQPTWSEMNREYVAKAAKAE